MVSLAAAAAAFVLLHLLISGTRLRDVLRGAIGTGPYMGLFSLASVALLAWLIFAFAAAKDLGPVFWGPSEARRWSQVVVQFFALLFVVVGLATPNPTSVRQEAGLERAGVVRGILRVTRHPFLWGVALWAAGHLLVIGTEPSLILFGSMFLLALFGTTSIDAKRAREFADAWPPFAAQTSNIPFAAVVAGRQRIQVGEIGVWRLGLAVAIWAALLVGHRYAFGVPALP